jgi:hypothetical protein
VDDLTGARAVGVTPEFARQMRQFDSSVDLDTIVSAKATGLNPEYYSQMRRLFPGLSLDDAVGMSAVGVTADFALQMRSLFPRASADDMQAMAAVGVTPEYVRQMRKQGLSAGNPDDVIESRVLFPSVKGKAAVKIPRVPVVNHAALATAITSSVATSLHVASEAVRGAVAAAPPTTAAPPGEPDDN